MEKVKSKGIVLNPFKLVGMGLEKTKSLINEGMEIQKESTATAPVIKEIKQAMTDDTRTLAIKIEAKKAEIKKAEEELADLKLRFVKADKYESETRQEILASVKEAEA